MTRPFQGPDDVIRRLGAVQAQDYAGAKWALAMRMQGAGEAELDRALSDGVILRTHVLRPTWHFVTPADIRWMLELTAPRVHAASAYHYRRLGLDDALFAQSNAVLVKALEGGEQLTRSELASAIEHSGTITGLERRQWLVYLLMRAELDGVICSGGLRGKQHTYALLDERAPQSRRLERDVALATLTQRYFTGHGPATLKDYTSWSGLLATDAQHGIAMVGSGLEKNVVGGESYWSSTEAPTADIVSPAAHLLPAYDEYTVAYKDRNAILDPRYAEPTRFGIGNVIAIDGVIAGTWRRTFEKGTVVVALTPFSVLTDAESTAVAGAIQAYGEFLGMPVVSSNSPNAFHPA